MRKYPSDIKGQVIAFRKKGLSFREISERTHVPKTTVVSWLSEDPISEEQKQDMRNKGLIALQRGRIIAQGLRKQESQIRENTLMKQGMLEIGEFSKRDLFVIGIALYWAEGFKNKHEHRLGFCNTDVNMIKFYLIWLDKILLVDKKDIVARVTVNISYKDKIEEIQQYWSEMTGIPLSSFTKPFYQNTKWKKEYNNDNYYGVLRIHVNKSMNRLLQMRGWIKGVSYNLPR